MLNKLAEFSKKILRKDKNQPVVFERSDHTISRKAISERALKVLRRLKKEGHAAYLVGGGVRDLLLDQSPKDFDIVTNAYPQEVHRLFRNSRIIGRRFRLVHVYFHREVIEVSTFRANTQDDNAEFDEEFPSMIRNDNVYGTIEEDAWRRDFTVNAMYYNIADYNVIDYTGGMNDLHRKVIRMIGDPVQRYHEDPVRLLRAIRLAAKLDFTIEKHTEQPIKKLAHLLEHVSSSRLFDEVMKLFFTGHAEVTYQRLQHYGYMKMLFPMAMEALQSRDSDIDAAFIKAALQATDQRFQEDKSLNPGFLFSVVLWPVLQYQLGDMANSRRSFQGMHTAIDDIFVRQNAMVAIPRKLKAMIRSIWVMQYHMLKRRPTRAVRVIQHRYFRAAIDFLELRVAAGETNFSELAQWWRKLESVGAKKREKMLAQLARPY